MNLSLSVCSSFYASYFNEINGKYSLLVSDCLFLMNVSIIFTLLEIPPMLELCPF